MMVRMLQACFALFLALLRNYSGILWLPASQNVFRISRLSSSLIPPFIGNQLTFSREPQPPNLPLYCPKQTCLILTRFRAQVHMMQGSTVTNRVSWATLTFQANIFSMQLISQWRLAFLQVFVRLWLDDTTSPSALTKTHPTGTQCYFVASLASSRALSMKCSIYYLLKLWASDINRGEISLYN